MLIQLFNSAGVPVDQVDIPEGVTRAAATVKTWMAANQIESLMGLGDVYAIQRKSNENGRLCDEAQDQLEAVLDKAEDIQRQLAEVTRERDTLKAMVDLHDALNDRRRAQANETPFKRRTYESL